MQGKNVQANGQLYSFFSYRQLNKIQLCAIKTISNRAYKSVSVVLQLYKANELKTLPAHEHFATWIPGHTSLTTNDLASIQAGYHGSNQLGRLHNEGTFIKSLISIQFITNLYSSITVILTDTAYKGSEKLLPCGKNVNCAGRYCCLLQLQLLVQYQTNMTICLCCVQETCLGCFELCG